MKQIIELVTKRYPKLGRLLEDGTDEAVDELCQLVARSMLAAKTQDPEWAKSEDGKAFEEFIAHKLDTDPKYAALYKQTLDELVAKTSSGHCGCCGENG